MRGDRLSKMIISPFDVMYAWEIDQLVQFYILYIIWLTKCSKAVRKDIHCN